METLSLLIVDDEPKMRLGMERVVSPLRVLLPDLEQTVQLEMTMAGSGEEALERIDDAQPDLMLLDLKLPGIDGIEVLRQVVSGGKDVAVIMITAYASIETAVSATKQGAFDFLPKPFTPQELRNTLEKATRHVIAQRRVRNLERERRQFRFQLISLVSHELKAPIGGIQSYLDALSYLPIEKAQEQIPHIVDRCRRRLDGMQKMISDLLDLTSIESGQKKRDPQKLDLAEVASSCVEVARDLGRERSIEVSARIPDELLFVADRQEMTIVLNNLLSNAVKYNKDDGKVLLELLCEEGGATIRVTDTGIGIPQEWIGRLFSEFVRVKTKETRQIEGSGLGLSIVKKIAGIYGGEVFLESRQGEGTIITVNLKEQSEVLAMEREVA